MSKKQSENILHSKQVKPTAMRILILDELLNRKEAVNIQDIEDSLGSADRVTIYRTLKTFVDHDIIHSVPLPEGGVKYALCRHSGQQHQVHPHFTCLQCGQTFCLPQTKITLQKIPENYVLQKIAMNISGYCPRCKEKR